MAQAGAASNAGGRAASRAGAFGGSEAGSAIGGMVGPPIIGNVIGSVVGEKVGGKVIQDTGLDRVAGQLNDDMAKVVGQERADKVGEIAMTAMGYSEAEKCICCPCMPASQIMFFVMLIFFIFNCSRLGIGIDFDAYCTQGLESSETLILENDDNSTDTSDYWVIEASNTTTKYLAAYPCEFGFHYLLAGAAVWIAFLPFQILTLFGNCYRQCCCCLCDPIVCCATATDCCKKCLCECGWFSVTAFCWYSMCIFQVIWTICGLVWFIPFVKTSDYHNYDLQGELINTLLASLALDLFIAGSEIVHKIRLWWVIKQNKLSDGNNQMGTEMTARSNPYVARPTSQQSAVYMQHQHPINMPTVVPQPLQAGYPMQA